MLQYLTGRGTLGGAGGVGVTIPGFPQMRGGSLANPAATGEQFSGPARTVPPGLANRSAANQQPPGLQRRGLFLPPVVGKSVAEQLSDAAAQRSVAMGEGRVGGLEGNFFDAILSLLGFKAKCAGVGCASVGGSKVGNPGTGPVGWHGLFNSRIRFMPFSGFGDDPAPSDACVQCVKKGKATGDCTSIQECKELGVCTMCRHTRRSPFPFFFSGSRRSYDFGKMTGFGFGPNPIIYQEALQGGARNDTYNTGYSETVDVNAKACKFYEDEVGSGCKMNVPLVAGMVATGFLMLQVMMKR